MRHARVAHTLTGTHWNNPVSHKEEPKEGTMEKRWEHITGEDVANLIINRMDELDMLATPEDAGRRGELTGHNAELQIIADHLRRLNEDREKPATSQPPTYFFLTVARAEDFPEAPSSEAAVLVQYEEDGKQVTKELRDLLDYLDFFTQARKAAREQGLEIRVMASSSMDFPKDYSNNEAVIDLARAIRSNEVTV
jgi:hypothetical protein